ncbi:MAG: LysM peptidoglycan-binding domain-containing protein [Eubacteriales bacterium]
MVIHTTQKGDTVFNIARRYGVSPTRLIDDNGLQSPDELTVGQSLVVLFPKRTYTVRGGDTAASICRRLGVDEGKLLRANPALGGELSPYPGQVLALDTAEPPKGCLVVNGYVESHIDEEALRRALPYLSYVSVTGGSFKDGSLRTVQGEERVLAMVKKSRAVPLLHTDTVEGDWEAMGRDFEDSLTNIIRSLKQKGYRGVCCHADGYCRLKAEFFRDLFGKLKRGLGAERLVLMLETDEPVYHKDPGLWQALAGLTDGLLLSMVGLESGLRARCEALSGSVHESQRSRLMVELPYFAVEECPYAERAKVRYVRPGEVLPLIRQAGAEIVRDANQLPYAGYRGSVGGRSGQHTLRFEDPRSIREGLQALGEAGLFGVSCYPAYNETSTFVLLSGMFGTIEPYF